MQDTIPPAIERSIERISLLMPASRPGWGQPKHSQHGWINPWLNSFSCPCKVMQKQIQQFSILGAIQWKATGTITTSLYCSAVLKITSRAVGVFFHSLRLGAQSLPSPAGAAMQKKNGALYLARRGKVCKFQQGKGVWNPWSLIPEVPYPWVSLPTFNGSPQTYASNFARTNPRRESGEVSAGGDSIQHVTLVLNAPHPHFCFTCSGGCRLLL